MVRHLYNLKVGDSLEFRGPCGGFEYELNKYREIGMLAGQSKKTNNNKFKTQTKNSK